MTKIILPLFCSTLLLTSLSACQPQSANETTLTENVPSRQLTPSAESLAMMDDYKSEYVTRVLNQQQSLQAAYKASSSADSKDTRLPNSSRLEQGSTDDTTIESSERLSKNGAETTQESTEKSEVSQKTDAQKKITEERDSKIAPLPLDDINKEVAESLPLANIVIPPPEILTAKQIEDRYRAAMADLYLPDEELLSSRSADTLLSITTLTPGLFKELELARRLTLKSPAMARLLRQYQVWEQIEAEQSIELAELKATQLIAQEEQREKFKKLMAEFNKTIKGYDEQIAKYEEILKDFEH